MGNQLLLLADTYPFADSNKPVESDLVHLAGVFDEVIVLAVEAGQIGESAIVLDEPTGTMPKNIKVHIADPPSDNTLRVACGSCADVAVDELRPYLSDYDNEALRKSPSRWVYFRAFSAKVVAIRDAVEKLVAEGVVRPGAVFCSYGLAETTVAALLARNLAGFAKTAVVVSALDADFDETASPTGYIPLRPWQLEQITRVFPGFADEPSLGTGTASG